MTDLKPGDLAQHPGHGLVDAGLLADDSPRFVHAVTYRTAPKASANVLVIEIKETR